MALKPVIPGGLMGLVNVPSGSTPAAGVKFSASNSADATPTAGTLTKLNFDTVDYNVGGAWNTSTSKFTPPAGYYLIGVNLPCDTGEWQIEVYKNGSDYKRLCWNLTKTISGSTVIKANGTDFFEIYANNSTGGFLNIYLSNDAGPVNFWATQLP